MRLDLTTDRGLIRVFYEKSVTGGLFGSVIDSKYLVTQ